MFKSSKIPTLVEDQTRLFECIYAGFTCIATYMSYLKRIPLECFKIRDLSDIVDQAKGGSDTEHERLVLK